VTLDRILKAIRKELNISQEILARDISVSFSSVNRWENGKSKPNPIVLVALKNYAAKNNVSREILDALNNIRT
jgi:DNA-binding transcriptional regulator YiaG